MAKVTTKMAGGLEKYIAELVAANGSGVRVGSLGGAIYNGGPLNGEPVAVNLARHEFGTQDIPARAPIRTTAEKKKNDWAKELAGYLREYAQGESLNIPAALVEAGDGFATDIQDAFADGLSPALKPATVARKIKMGYGAYATTPVVLTGQAQRSITAEYIEGQK